MKALGIGWTVQDAMYNTSSDGASGEGDVTRMPPVVTAKNIGVVIGAGTDAHRVSTYNPFTVLQWFLDGRNAGGTATPRTGGDTHPRRCASLLHSGKRLGLARRTTARLARGGEVGRPGGAVERLHDGARG